jgi:hypothetical protein
MQERQQGQQQQHLHMAKHQEVALLVQAVCRCSSSRLLSASRTWTAYEKRCVQNTLQILLAAGQQLLDASSPVNA